jgi:penicillin-binding protein 1A
MDSHGALRVGRLIVTRLALIVVLVVGTALLLATTFVPAVLTADAAVDTVEREMFDHPPLPDDIPHAPQITHVHDVSGDRIAEIHGPIEREPVPLEEISQTAIGAVIATEDASFHEHDGVNHDAMVRAGLRNLQEGGIAEGASTITQQLVTMAFLEPEPTIERKLNEVVWAIELEERMGKDEILEGYLNRVYLGHGVYGIGTAAEYYFSTPASDLDLAQSATLAGAIRAPMGNNPVDEPEAAAARRDVVVGQMLDQGMIGQEEADEVLGSDLEVDVREDDPGEPFWEDLVKRVVYDPRVDLQPGLQEAVGDSVEERVDALFEAGLRITTTLDRGMHGHAAQTLASYVDDPINDPLASLITLDHTTGAVRAMAVGPKEFGPCEDGDDACATTQVNPTTPGIGSSGRQSGSAFKPFVAAAALEQDLGVDTEYDTPSGEEIEDCGWGEEWEPENFDLEDHGEIEMDEAMRDSTNVYFAKLARDAEVGQVVEAAQRHGLTHSPNLGDFGSEDCSIGLGTAEIFPWEMAGGYGTWANDGLRCEPYLIEEIRDRDGEVIYAHEPECERILDADVADTMRQLLEEPVGSDGTAAVVGDQVPGAFGKTGTTNDFRDAWFVGAADDHTTSAWIGFEQPRPMRDVTVGGQWHESVTGGAVPAPMWAEYVSGLP